MQHIYTYIYLFILFNKLVFYLITSLITYSFNKYKFLYNYLHKKLRRDCIYHKSPTIVIMFIMIDDFHMKSIQCNAVHIVINNANMSTCM